LKNGFGLSPSAADLATGASMASGSASMPILSSWATCFGVAANSTCCGPVFELSKPPSATSKPRSSSVAAPAAVTWAEYGARPSAAEAAAGTSAQAASEASSATGARERIWKYPPVVNDAVHKRAGASVCTYQLHFTTQRR
jgi:hypothetical protein